MKNIFIISLVFLLSFVLSQKVLKAQQSIDTWLEDSIFKNASVGLLIVEQNTNEVIYQKNENTSLIPASCMKLFSTATACEVLGQNFKFKTEIAYSGKIAQNGSLHGNIYIIGYGDPALGAERFANHYLKPENFIDEWIQAIKDAGIKKIEGSIIGDASEFCMPYQPGTWLYEDIGNYYASPISGLSIYENIYKLDFATGFNNGDSTVILGMKPHIEGYSFNNQVVSADKGGDQAYIMGGTASSQKLVVGSLPFRKLSYTIRGSIDNPPLLAAQILNDELKKAGITISKQPRSTEFREIKPKVNKLHTTYSPNLKLLCDATNLWSLNLYAEHLAIASAIKMSSIGSVEKDEWFNRIAKFWESKGMDIDGMQIMDGSGLSVFNTLTASQLVFLLQYMQTKSENAEMFLSSLPVAGKSGTLAYYCRNTSGKGKVFAKTGSMKAVRSIAGYAETKSGKKVNFALIINHYNPNKGKIRNHIEDFLNILTSL